MKEHFYCRNMLTTSHNMELKTIWYHDDVGIISYTMKVGIYCF